MNSIEAWTQPPNHEKDANEFVRRVNEEVAPEFEGLEIRAKNIISSLLDRTQEVRDMPKEEGEFHLSGLDDADRMSAHHSLAGVVIWADSREYFEAVTKQIDRVASECNGARSSKPIDTEDSPLNLGWQWMRDLYYFF